MKHYLLRLFLIPLLFCLPIAAYSQSISHVLLSSTAVCNGSTLTVSYDRGNFAVTDPAVDRVELSDGLGMFGAPVVLTTDSPVTATSHTLSITIPTGTAAGAGYKIRITAADSVNGVAIIVSDTVSIAISDPVTAPLFTLGSVSAHCGSAMAAYSASSNGTIVYSLVSNPLEANNVIDAATGELTFHSGYEGQIVVTAEVTGCNGTLSSTHTIDVEPALTLPVFATGLPITRCEGDAPFSYTATSNGDITYSIVTIPANKATIDAAGVATFDADFSGTATVTATVTGCNGTQSATHALTVDPVVTAPQFAIGLPITRCEGDAPFTYNATSTGLVTYSIITVPANKATIDAAGLAAFDADFSGTATITASVSGCNGTVVSTHAITVDPVATLPVFTAGLPTTRCEGDAPFIYTATSNGTITYSIVTVPANKATIDAAGEATFNADFFGTATITAEVSGCNGTLSATHGLTIEPKATAPVFTTGLPVTRCEGDGPAVYDAISNAPVSYTITTTPANKATIDAAGEATFDADFFGTATVTASAIGCNGMVSTTHGITVDPKVTQPVFTTGLPVSRCEGDGPTTYNASSNGLVTYSIVTVPAGKASIDGTGQATFDADFFGTATVTARVIGCNGMLQSTHAITVEPKLTTPVFAASLPTSRCQGAAPETYAATSNGSVIYSIATVPAGMATINANGEATFDAGFHGTARVTATVTGCNGTLSATHDITVNETISLLSFGPGTRPIVCQGAQSIAFNLSAPLGLGLAFNVNGVPALPANAFNILTRTLSIDANYIGDITIGVVGTGCNSLLSAAHTVRVLGTISKPSFINPPGTRCQGATNVQYPVTRSHDTALRYSLVTTPNDPATRIDSLDGTVHYGAGFFGTATIRATAYGCGGPLFETYTVTTNGTVGKPVFDAGLPATRCQGAGTERYTASSANDLGTMRYRLSLSPADAGTTIDSITGEVTFSVGFAGNATIRAEVNGCGGAQNESFLVKVVGVPVFTPVAQNPRCEGYGVVTYLANSVNTTGLSYTLETFPENPSGDSVLTHNVSGRSIVFNPDFYGRAVITATAAGCPGSTTSSYTITVRSKVREADLNLPAEFTECQGEKTILLSASAVYMDSVRYTAVASPGATGTYSLDRVTGSFHTDALFTGRIRIKATAYGCARSSDSDFYVHVVTPTVSTPVFLLGLPKVRCQKDDSTRYSAMAPNSTELRYSISTLPTAGGATIDPVTAWAKFDTGFAGTATITATATGCNGSSSMNHVVTVTPTVGLPVFDDGDSTVRCQGARTQTYLARATDNTRIIYSISTKPADQNTVINPVSGAVTFSAGFSGVAVITAEAQGCNGARFSDHVVTVIGTPRFRAGLDVERCQGPDLIRFDASSDLAPNIVYSMVADPADPFTILDTATGDIRFSADYSGTIRISALACDSGDRVYHSIAVIPTPHNITVSDSTCTGNAPAARLYSSQAGGTFKWSMIRPLSTNLRFSGQDSGFTNIITGPILVDTNTVRDDTAYFSVITTTRSARNTSCSGRDTVMIRVKHGGAITTPLAHSICSGTSTNLLLSSTDGTGTFAWSSPANGAVRVNGLPNAGSGCSSCNSITQILQDTGINTAMVMYYTHAISAGCKGKEDTIRFTVNPTPIIISHGSYTSLAICSGMPLAIVLQDTFKDNTSRFSWTRVVPQNVSAGSMTSGQVLLDVLVNSSPSVIPTPLVYTVYDTTLAGCGATPIQIAVTVNPQPQLVRLSTPVCSGDSTRLTLAATTGGGSTFDWQPVRTGSVSGATSGRTVLLNNQLYNAGFTSTDTVIYTAIPTSSAGCVGRPDSVVVFVHPLPKMTSRDTASLCSDEPFRYFVQASTGPFASYTYSRNSNSADVPPKTVVTAMNVAQPIDEVLTSRFETREFAVSYAINLSSAQGCKFDNQPLNVRLLPTPDSPGIGTFPPATICRNTVGLNFGAARAQAPGERFLWSSNQQIKQLGDSTSYALATFANEGSATVSVVAQVPGFGCSSKTSTRNFRVTADGNSVNPNVVLFAGNLICQGNNIVRYQWGYDRRINLDSVMLPGASYQNLFVGAGSGFDADSRYYWVMATFTDGCVRKAYFNEPSLNIKPSKPGGVSSELRLYPNPASDFLTVELSESIAGGYTVELFDLTGRRVSSTQASGSRISVPVTNLVPGTYVISAMQEGRRLGVGRFVKQ